MNIQAIRAQLEVEFREAFEARKAKRDNAKAALDEANKALDEVAMPAKVPHLKWADIKDGAAFRWNGDVTCGASIPDGVVPQLWHVSMDASVLDTDVAEAKVRFIEPAAQTLAAQGLALGLDCFAPLEVVDRPKEVRKANQTVSNMREAAVVVYAKGWKA